ncbi:hypothetical protein LPJ73_006357, partial [Coemansia sp. RSA 2703]
MMRNGIIGNGIWENYTRKRVSVNWIRTKQRSVADMDPVDILIETVFGCCFEALGGTVMSLNELCNAWVPFTSAFEPLHRVRTYPCWSRKFAHEISAVVDRYVAVPDEPSSADGVFTWSVEVSPDMSQIAGFGLQRIISEPQRWLRDGRSTRQYDLAEMVALAGEHKRNVMWRADHARQNKGRVFLTHAIPLDMWPMAVRLVTGESIPYRLEQALSEDAFNDCFLLARVMTDDQITRSYVAIVPVNNQVAVMYALDQCSYEEASKMSGLSNEEYGCEAESFDAAWIEDWALQLSDTVPIEPLDTCAIDVHVDQFSQELLLSKESSAQPILPEPDTKCCVNDLTEDCPADAVPLDSSSIICLESWFAKAYLMAAVETKPDLEYALDSLESLFVNLEDKSKEENLLGNIRQFVLRSSLSIEDTFSADAKRSDVVDTSSTETVY